MQIYVVQPGDTVDSIALAFGASPDRIRSDNGIRPGQRLVPGQALVIEIPTQTHVVEPGQTLQQIAAQYGTTVLTLLQNNPSLTGRPPVAGETIAITLQTNRLGTILVNGYVYTYIDLALLQEALPFLSRLTIFGYGFTDSGQLVPADDEEMIRLAKEYGAEPYLLLSSINETGTFNSFHAAQLFRSPEQQEFLLQNLISIMQTKGYKGIDIDFEFIEPEVRQSYLDFLQTLTDRMHAAGFGVNVDLAPKTSADQPGILYESHDYAAIGRIVDTVLLMTYEWGYKYGPPLAIAPLPQVTRVIDYGLTEIPASKILMGIPNYAYDWPLPFIEGATEAATIGNLEAVQIADRYGVPIAYDAVSQAPNFVYTASDGVTHEVWFEDARSIAAKFELCADRGLRGIGYWNLMRPFPQNWPVLNSYFNIEKTFE